MQISVERLLTRQGGAMVANCQAQCPKVPGQGQVNIGAGVNRRACHELADNQAHEGDDLAHPPVLQGSGDELARRAWRSRVRRKSYPLNGRGGGRQHRGNRGERRLGHNQVRTLGVGAQLLANLRVWARHGYGDPGPVANVAPRRCEDVDRHGLGALEHTRQITDHATGPLGEGQLYSLVQIIADITELTCHLKDQHLTNSARPGQDLPTQAGTTG